MEPVIKPIVAAIRAWTPADLAEVAEVIGELRHSLLCGEVIEGHAPTPEQHMLLGLAALDQARSHLLIAQYTGNRERAAMQKKEGCFQWLENLPFTKR